MTTKHAEPKHVEKEEELSSLDKLSTKAKLDKLIEYLAKHGIHFTGEEE